MRAVIQRVSRASVSIQRAIHSSIGPGLLVFLGIEDSDNQIDISWLAAKIAKLRIFDDDKGVMNRSVVEADGSILLVSQFTLHASTKKGNRPSYARASKAEIAVPLYEAFSAALSEAAGRQVKTGVFGAEMAVDSINEGPVTIIIDSKARE